MRELSLHVLDVLENALAAGATAVNVRIVEDPAVDRLTIEVRDNGQGMDTETVQQVLDPFFTTRTTRHVGLGLPLFAAAARRCDGDLIVDSAPGCGTMVTATFRHSHLDRAPLGDMPGTLLAYLLHGDGNTPRLGYYHQVKDRAFDLDTAAIEAELGGIPLSYPAVRTWLQDYIREGEAQLSL
jgi:anti-sigma regulatory factor (Ser/Thr protein kinase)